MSSQVTPTRRKYRSASVAPVALVLSLILLAGTISLARIVAGTGEEEFCVPTSARDCGCVSDSAALAGATPADDLELAPRQRDYREEEFMADGVASRYRIFDAGIDFSSPIGVLVRLHGDGAYEVEGSDRLAACLAAVAAEQNMILVQPLTPAKDKTWWQDLPTNTAWLEALFEERISTLRGVDPTRVWWMGYSGGAEMITYGLLPDAQHIIPGGAIMVGGGGAPTRVGSTTVGDRIPESKKECLPLHWASGSRDTGDDPRSPFDALSASQAGAEFYRQAGFQVVSTDFDRDEDHFTTDQLAILHEALEDFYPAVDGCHP